MEQEMVKRSKISWGVIRVIRDARYQSVRKYVVRIIPQSHENLCPLSQWEKISLHFHPRWRIYRMFHRTYCNPWWRTKTKTWFQQEAHFQSMELNAPMRWPRPRRETEMWKSQRKHILPQSSRDFDPEADPELKKS